MSLTKLVPWPDRRVIAFDDVWIAVDKPLGIPVHGGDERERSDVVSRLADWLEARGEDTYLGVHQRLDQDASGVLFFTRSRSVNKDVARDMEQHRAERTYVVGIEVDAQKLTDSGTLEHRLEAGKDQIMRAVQRGGKLARLRFQTLKRNGDRALVRVQLETGRTHQIRAQFCAAGHPIAGDRMYGGRPASRLMLHATELRLPALERRAEAPLPTVFGDWLAREDADVIAAAVLADENESAAPLTRALEDAASLRFPLCDEASAFRLVNAAGDGLPGLTVDCYGDWAFVSVTSASAEAIATRVAEWLVDGGMRGVYWVRRPRADLREHDAADLAPAVPLLGETATPELVVNEGMLQFAVALGGDLSTGLFVDQRENRARVREISGGKRVLNLFAYTCSFGVAAAAGGARKTVNVDLSAPFLARGRANYELNGLVPDVHGFEHADAVAWLEEAVKRGDQYDVIVLDPPTFSTKKGGTFQVAKDYGNAAALALQVLAPRGRLLAVTNHRKTTLKRFRAVLRDAAAEAGCSVKQIKDLKPPLDCPTPLDGDRAKSVLVTLE